MVEEKQFKTDVKSYFGEEKQFKTDVKTSLVTVASKLEEANSKLDLFRGIKKRKKKKKKKTEKSSRPTSNLTSSRRNNSKLT